MNFMYIGNDYFASPRYKLPVKFVMLNDCIYFYCQVLKTNQ